MATLNDDYLCRRLDFTKEEQIDINKVLKFVKNMRNKLGKDGNIVIFNIGSAKLVGDSFAPRLGSYLRMLGLDNISVYGTMENPIHALNCRKKFEEMKDEICENDFVIAVDASVSVNTKERTMTLKDKPVHPRKGVDSNNELPLIGDMAILYSIGNRTIHELHNYNRNNLIEDVRKLGDFIKSYDNYLAGENLETNMLLMELLCKAE